MGRKCMAAVLLASALLAGCGNTAAGTEEAAAKAGDINDTGVILNAEESGAGAPGAEGAYTGTTIDRGDVFSKRDLSGEYDASACRHIMLSDSDSTCEGGGAEAGQNAITITEEGEYILSGSLSDGMIIVDVDKSEKVQLILDGVDIQSKTSAAIYVRQADKVFVTLAGGTENVLSNGGEFIAIDDSNIDAVIFSKDDLTLNGAGSLTVTSPAGHGIVSKNGLAITGGSYGITAALHGLAGRDSVGIAKGSFGIEAGRDGIHSAGDEDDTVGWVYIEGGTFHMNVKSDGISADNEVYIAGGTVIISESEEGIEARVINICGGEVDITSSDDGLNAADKGSSAAKGGMMDTDGAANINISGGIIHINAEGDGIDTNGYLTVSGGETYVAGPSGGGDGALDYGIAASINGGIVVAAGQSSMAVNFDETSTQGSILANIGGQQEAGTQIALFGGDGTKLIEWTMQKRYNSVVISCPQIVDGGLYTVKMGDTETEITMDGLIYGEGLAFP